MVNDVEGLSACVGLLATIDALLVLLVLSGGSAEGGLVRGVVGGLALVGGYAMGRRRERHPIVCQAPKIDTRGRSSGNRPQRSKGGDRDAAKVAFRDKGRRTVFGLAGTGNRAGPCGRCVARGAAVGGYALGSKEERR
jgi:hypothetical protein